MSVHYPLPVVVPFGVLLLASGCGSSDKSDGQFKADIVTGMHKLVLAEIEGLNLAARDLQTAAPTGHGWDATLDAKPIAAMIDAWVRTRVNWEQAEGTLECLFKALDGSMDSRYEDLLAGGDADPFDGQGVTGMHAVERILFAPTTPAAVVTYEMSLAGSQAATWPATDTEATEFKTGLCQRLVSDTQSLLDQWKTQPIDLATVFQGLTGLMSAQADKLRLAVDQKEESRYSAKTMADLRLNLMGTAGTAGTTTGGIYGLFTPWLLSRTYGATLGAAARRAFVGLAQTYSTIDGDAIPAPPATWSSSNPTVEDQQSTFGKLYEAVVQQVDPNRSGSAVESMNQVANALGLPPFTGKDCPN
jgi:iron uptake system component EfeO